MRGEVLKRAYDLINGERRDQYGAPENSFPIIAALWREYLMARGAQCIVLDGHDVAMMMILLKIARAANGYKDDTYLDIAGYTGIGDDLAAVSPSKTTATMGVPGDANRTRDNGMDHVSDAESYLLPASRSPKWPMDLSGSGGPVNISAATGVSIHKDDTGGKE